MTPEFPEAQAPLVRKAIAKARATEYLKQRDAEDVLARAKQMNERLERDRKWLADYRASGKAKSKFNWGTITSPINRSTTDEKSKAGAEAQAAEVRDGEGLGDAPQERAAPQVAGAGDEQSSVRRHAGNPGQSTDQGRESERWEREGDTPF
jgi:hypothetical protein